MPSKLSNAIRGHRTAARLWLADRFPSFRNLFIITKIDRFIIPGVMGVILLPLVGLSLLLKIWTTTPVHFETPVKISIFDQLQARSLALNAEQLAAAGRLANARRAWALAVANDPGNEQNVRHALLVQGKDIVTRETGRDAAIFGIWLLRLTQTNRSDLTLVLETLEHNRRHQEILALVDGQKEGLTHEARMIQLRSLFHFGQYRLFQEAWKRHAVDFERDPLMKTYRHAVTAILNPHPDNFRDLDASYTDLDAYNPYYLKSRQVALRAHAVAQHSRACRTIFNDLKKRRIAQLPDHITYWHHLIRNGLTDWIAENFTHAGNPVTETEAVMLSRTLHLAGLKSESAQLAQQAITEFGADAPRLWITFGDQLTRDQEWRDLSALARQVHNNQLMDERLGPMARYWEALTAWHMDHKKRAHTLFEEIAQNPPTSPPMRFELAKRLLALGQKETADLLVKSQEGNQPEIRGYWGQRAGSAAQDKDLKQFAEIAKSAYESDPEFVPHINNYLSALLGNRQEPELALELSAKLIKADPNHIVFRLNRAHALCLNERWDEADRILNGITPIEIADPAVFSDFQLARFRLSAGRGLAREARTIYKSLSLDHYMDGTRRWLKKRVAELE